MSNDLPARWRDDDSAPSELRELGSVLGSLDEPPPTGARARVWHAVQQPPRPRVLPRLAWAGVAAAAAAIVAMTWVPGTPRADVARVDALLGGALEVDGAPSHIGQTIGSDGQLSTGDRGRAVVRLLDVGVAYLASKTEAVIASDTILLESGTVVSSVEPRGTKKPFRVIAGDYQVQVVGTLFQVHHDKGAVDVRVHEGTVDVRGPMGRTRVHAGGSFSSRGAEVAPITEEAVEALGGHSTVSMARPRLTAEPIPEKRARPQRARQLAPERADEPALAPSVKPNTDQPEPSPPARAEGDKYVEAVGSKDVERAIALFDELIAAGGPRAEVAAYQAARLARERDLNEAIRRYEASLSAHPQGVFAQEARLDVIECAMQLGKWDKASFHIDVFLDAYPESERSAEVHFLRAEVARQHDHDCAAAITDYDAAMSSPRRAGDALFFKAWCLLRHENTAAALPLLERYLERFPVGRHAQQARARVREIRSLNED